MARLTNAEIMATLKRLGFTFSFDRSLGLLLVNERPYRDARPELHARVLEALGHWPAGLKDLALLEGLRHSFQSIPGVVKPARGSWRSVWRAYWKSLRKAWKAQR